MDHLNFIPLNDDSSSDDEPSEPPIKRNCPSHRVWVKSEEFATAEEAEKSVHGIWKKCSRTKTQQGLRIDYRCSGGAYRINECPARLYLLYHDTSTKVTMFRTAAEHENHLSVPRRGLSEELKSFITLKFEEGITKPNAIISLLRDKKLQEPVKSKISTFLRTLRLKKYGPTTVSAQDIRLWCDARSAVPADEDTPFVLGYIVQCTSSNIDDQVLRIVMSTRRLLLLASKSSLVHCDATYKVTWEGFPLLIIGTSDCNKKFHPFAISVSKGETSDDYAYIFKKVGEFSPEWQPKILVADAAEAITAGFIEVFGEPELCIMCFFHVRKNIEKYVKVITREGHNKDFLGDLFTLQSSKDDATFMKAAELFLKKWRDINSDFAEYFEKQWVTKNSKWYEGAGVGLPSTNNGLESLNGKIKQEHTLRERLPLGQFLNGVTQYLRKWSEDRNPASVNCIPFSTNYNFSLRDWTAAHQWAQQKHKTLERAHPTPQCRQYFVASSKKKTKLTTACLKKMISVELKWKTFEEFRMYSSEIWVVTINSTDLRRSTCTCPSFLKMNCCKHILGLQIRLKMVEAPQQAREVPLGQKRKRGRPKKCSHALIID